MLVAEACDQRFRTAGGAHTHTTGTDREPNREEGLARVTRYVEPAGGVSVARRSQWHDSLTCAGGQDTRERESRAQNDHGLSPRARNGTHKRHIPVDQGPLLARAMSTRPFSSKEPQERCKTVHVAMNAVRNKNGTICHHDHGIGRNKGRVPAVLMADSARALHIRPWLHTSNDDGLNGVRGGECWPHPNDMHTDEHRPQRQTLDRISRTCTGRVAGREARRSGMLRAAHPLSSARRRRAPRWATQQPYLGECGPSDAAFPPAQ